MGKVRNILATKDKNVFSVDPSTSVYMAIQLMAEKNIGGLMITENGKFVGIFTERDYARKLILKGKSSKEVVIGELMSKHPFNVTVDTTIEQCMQLMSNNRIRYLPVVENEKLIGVVSMGDLVRYIIEEQKTIIEQLEHYITS